MRPLNARELALSNRSRGGPASHFRHKKRDGSADDTNAWTISSSGDTITQKGARQVRGRTVFSFDSIFSEDSPTQQIYESMVQPILSSVCDGRNGTIFAYGQTNSGKTFTMQGGGEKNDGIIQMVASDLFRIIKERDTREFSVCVSHIEIYSERVRDLLESSQPSDDATTRSHKTGTGSNKSIRQKSFGDLKTLAIREDPKRGGVYVNCKEIIVHSADDIVNILERGSKNRASSGTTMNECSSRSHAIFRITVTSREKGDDIGRVVRVSTLNCVDLAGSENGHQPTSARQREGGKINQR